MIIQGKPSLEGGLWGIYPSVPFMWVNGKKYLMMSNEYKAARVLTNDIKSFWSEIQSFILISPRIS